MEAKNKNAGCRTPDVERPKAMLAADRVCRTQEQAAKYAGVNIRTVQRWVKDGMLRATINDKPCYIKDELDRFKASKGHKTTDARARQEEADADYRELKARHMQLELDIKQGKYVPAEEVERGRLKRIVEVKRMLFAIPRKITPLLLNQPANRIQELLRREMVYAVNIFAEPKEREERGDEGRGTKDEG